MPRIKIDLPEKFAFATIIAVRITDLNYGGHVGNDKILSFMHEARMRFLQSIGYSELEMESVGLIMADSGIIYKNEIHYGDELQIATQPVEFNRVGFDLIYQIEKKADGKKVLVAIAKTAMVCFDYKLKKVVPLPEAARIKLSLG